MTRLAAAAHFALAAALCGCSISPIRIYDDGTASPRSVTPDEAAIRAASDEPMVCVFALRERRSFTFLAWFTEAGKFTSYRYLTRENPDPRGCGVLVSIRHTGASVWATDYVDVYSIRGGKLLWQAQGEGHAGPWMGFQSIAVFLKSAIQPGGEMRAKLDALAASTAPIKSDWVAKTAGNDMMSWDEILKDVYDPDGRLAAMRDREVASARSWAQEAAQAAMAPPEPEAKNDPKAWWAK